MIGDVVGMGLSRPLAAVDGTDHKLATATMAANCTILMDDRRL